MDLRSAYHTASYNPVGLMFRLGGAKAPWAWHGWPFPTEPPMLYPPGDDGRGGGDGAGDTDHKNQGPRARYGLSAVKHELAHIACFTHTRLGVVVSIETARLRSELLTAPQGIRLPVSQECARLLGVFLPLLEGLAMFAEVDYDEAKDDRILPHPVPMFAQSEASGMHLGEDGLVHDVARDWSLFDHDDASPGLLHLLFADIERPDLIHYTVGYLWVRAAAELIGRICPGLARPSVMLPLLTKLLCDHPVITRLYRREVTVHDAANALRSSVLHTSKEAWDRLDSALADDGLRATFDLWDLHTFLADPTAVRPFVDRSFDAEFFGGVSVPDDVNGTRMAAHVWLWSEIQGEVIDGTTNDSEVRLRIRDTSTGVERDVPIMGPAKFWRLFLANVPGHPFSSRMAALHEEASRFWAAFARSLAELRGKNVRISPIFSFSEPPLLGTIVWIEGAPRGMFTATVLTPDFYVHREEGNTYAKMLLGAGQFPPWERDALVSTVSGWEETTGPLDTCIQALLADLCSDPGARARLLDRRLDGLIPSREARHQLRKWMSFSEHAFFRTTTRPSPAVLDALEGALDLPGFRSVPGGDGMRAGCLLREAYPPLEAQPPHSYESEDMPNIRTAEELEAYLASFSEDPEVRSRIARHAIYRGTEGDGSLPDMSFQEGRIGGPRTVYNVALKNWQINIGDLFEAMAAYRGTEGDGSPPDMIFQEDRIIFPEGGFWGPRTVYNVDLNLKNWLIDHGGESGDLTAATARAFFSAGVSDAPATAEPADEDVLERAERLRVPRAVLRVLRSEFEEDLAAGRKGGHVPGDPVSLAEPVARSEAGG